MKKHNVVFPARNRLLLAACCFFSLMGCSDEVLRPPATTFSYFPTDSGCYRIFRVDSIVHAENDNNNDDSVYRYHFQLMESIDTSFLDGSGDSAQVVLRYRRTDSLSAWSLCSVWTQRLTVAGAFRTEENITYQKLAFPIALATSWNANAANLLGEEIHYYESNHRPAVIGPFSFDSTVTVFERDEDNFVERIYGREIYASHVGLVFKRRDELVKRNGMTVSGTEYRMELLGYGRR